MQRRFIITAFLVALTATGASVNPAEKYLATNAMLPFTAAGSPALPKPMLKSLTQGKLSPIFEFILVVMTLRSALRKVLEHVPDPMTSLAEATAIYDWGNCRLMSAYDDATMFSFMSGSATEAGGGGKDFLLPLLQSLSKRDGCETDGSKDLAGLTGAMDPGLGQFVQGMK